MTYADIAAVAAWIAATPLWQRYALSEIQARANLEDGLRRGDVMLVADVAGTACGLAWCVLKGAFGRSAYLRLLGVRAGYGGRGIGGDLLRHAEQHVRHASPELFLLVSDFNTAAQRFYRRAGYRHVGAIPGYVLPDVTELIFWKRLTDMPDTG